MPPWLYIWIARFASGERFRKATPAEWRYHLGFFFLFPVCLALAPVLEHTFLARANNWLVAFAIMGLVVIFFAATYIWARHVSAVVSLVLGIVAWAVFAWLAWDHS